MEEARTLHWLPCSINYTGVAKVSAYFLPSPTGAIVDGKAIQEAFFRGRQLKGTRLQLPSGFHGRILRRAAEQQADLNTHGQWAPDVAFSEFFYWKHGLDPIRTDSAQRRLDFLKISEQEYKIAIENAINYDVCQAETGAAKLACEIDKATVNIGALFSRQVEGRVSTEVDPRLAYDTEAIMTRAQGLLKKYEQMGISKSRILLRIPGTFEGIQAAKQLEAQGIQTHIILVYSFVQATAAAQAGVSVIQPNIGRVDDWFHKYPGVIRDPKGPREDSGFLSDVNPGVRMAARMYNYCQKYHPKTKVMVSGLRKAKDALALAGVDYLVVGPKVLATLSETPTLQGYNDGLTTLPGDDEYYSPRLSPEAAKEAEFEDFETGEVNKQLFEEGLGLVGVSLLKQGVQGLVDDIERLEPFFQNLSVGQE
ncbi:hypothetical protein WJX75_003327 [Coccomyxa subellipsoidea]|uniref:Transaldolase n=1 Tax=Coccomyxa subellipsoidea TaxID=248742 RepID=A0ABR2YYN8_9CHLO